MPIQIRFKLTFDDYLKAQQLHSKRSFGPHLWYVLSRTLVPVVGVLYVLFCAIVPWRTTSIGWLIVVLVCGTYFTFYPLFMRLRLNRIYRRTRTDDGENSAEIGPEAIHIEARNTNSNLNWGAVQSYRENKNIFLLYLAPGKFIVLPKRVFSPEQITEMQSLLASHVKSGS
jgi:YcxB-like protein